jgi:hypothetical protein
VDRPKFAPFVIDVDWKSLPADLIYPIFTLLYQIETLEHHISSVSEFDNPPDYSDTFLGAPARLALPGIEVSSLASRLRDLANLPALPVHRRRLGPQRMAFDAEHLGNASSLQNALPDIVIVISLFIVRRRGIVGFADSGSIMRVIVARFV